MQPRGYPQIIGSFSSFLIFFYYLTCCGKTRKHLPMFLGRANDAGEADFQIPVDLVPIISHPYLIQLQFLLVKAWHSCFVLDRVEALIGCSEDGHRSQNVSGFTRKLEHGCTTNTSSHLWAIIQPLLNISRVVQLLYPHLPFLHGTNSLLSQETWR
jgi:hypothetical protein